MKQSPPMVVDYWVTTYLSRLPKDRPLVMVDGTVPGWQAGSLDLHFDHHRPGGMAIQIDEIPHPQPLPSHFYMVTTVVDADACSAAAWLQLGPEWLTPEVIHRLRAIAWDCDHLLVPADLQDYSQFAFKAVAAMKLSTDGIIGELGLPLERKAWTQVQRERWAALAFQRSTEWLMDAARGECPWPGALGEADHYWQIILSDAHDLLTQNRISLYPTATGAVAVCDSRGWGHGLDPRSFYRALSQISPSMVLRPETITIREHHLGGNQYTLGVIPLHPAWENLDYTLHTYGELTHKERLISNEAGPWGGRRTVGGSGWNHPSYLEPKDIVAVFSKGDVEE